MRMGLPEELQSKSGLFIVGFLADFAMLCHTQDPIVANE